MKTRTTLIALAMILLAIAPVLALTTSTETASVSRLVGNAPEDLINQLDASELNLNHASYYGQQPLLNDNSYEKNVDILKSMFNDYKIGNDWNYNSIDLNAFKSNELLVIESDRGSIDGNNLKSIQKVVELTPDKATSWKGEFAQHFPLFIFDSDYAGLAIPGKSSFVRNLGRYSQIIAPTFLGSGEFVRAMICNLGDSKSLGNSFREARNRYFETANPEDEMIGLMLNSYHLYGNPLSITTTQKYDKSALEKYCGNLLGKKESLPSSPMAVSAASTPQASSDFIPEGSTQTFAKTAGVLSVQADVPSASSSKIEENVDMPYNILAINGSFEILEVSGANNRISEYELVEPVVVKQYNLPLDAVVTNIAYDFTNPEELLANIPEYINGPANRSCYSDGENASFATKITYGEGKQTVSLFLSPLEMINCSEGTFRMYKNAHYTIDYNSNSPIYFDNLNYPAKLLPNAQFNLTSEIKYAREELLNGAIELLEGDNLVYQQELNLSAINNLTIALTSPDREGFTKYKLRYSENGTVLSEWPFEIETRALEFNVVVPEIVKGSATIKLQILNNRLTPVSIKVHDNLLLNDSKKSGSYNEYSLATGLNEFIYSYSSLLQADQKYKLQFDLGYDNKKEVVNGLIVTNHKPLLADIQDIQVKEGDLIKLNVTASDMDGDAITYSISEPVGNDLEWQTKIGDAGNYTVAITASDGYVSDISNVEITILSYNSAPTLADLENITVNEGDLVSVALSATDEDGDNITYSVKDSRFNKTDTNRFEWQTKIGDAGNYTVAYGASDGKNETTKTFNLEIKLVGNISCFKDLDCATTTRTCYQETANASSSKDGVCGLNYNGNYVTTRNGAYPNGADNYLYVNYSTPAAALGAIWQIKHGNLPTYNVTIPDSCFDVSIVKLRVYLRNADAVGWGGDGRSISYGQCFSRTANGWINITQVSTNISTVRWGAWHLPSKGYDGDWGSWAAPNFNAEWMASEGGVYVEGGRIYEEAIIWKVTSNHTDWIGNLSCSGNNVTQLSRTPACINPGTASSRCEYSENLVVKATCPRGCASGACINSSCLTKTECGTDSYIGNTSCVGDSLMQNYRTYTCANAGTASASCSLSEVPIKVGNCSITCSAGYTGNVTCNGAVVQKEYLNSNCSKTWVNNQTCAYGCTNGTCINPSIACYNASDCGSSIWTGAPYCKLNDVWQTQKWYICNNAGTINASCTYAMGGRLKSTCYLGPCVNGSCTTDPCSAGYTGKIRCNGAIVQKEYQNPDCSLTWNNNQTCTYGCTNGTCNPQPCTNECTSGQTRCLSLTTKQTCGNYDSDSCTEWGNGMSCPLCLNGNCMTPCTPGYTGKVTCNGAVVQKEYLNSNCSKTWVNNQTCAYGCSNGVCNPQPCTNECAPSSYPSCSVSTRYQCVLGIDGCYDRIGTSCIYGCLNGACNSAPPCTNMCTNGQKRCLDSKTTQTCGDYNSDGCFEWSSPQLCPLPGYECINGVCDKPVCALGYTGVVRCNGAIVQKEYLNSNCSKTWINNQTCAYGCANGTCQQQVVSKDVMALTLFKVTSISLPLKRAYIIVQGIVINTGGTPLTNVEWKISSGTGDSASGVISSLAVGESKVAEGRFTYTAGKSYSARLVVDPNNKINETNEGNNQRDLVLNT